MLRSLLIAGLIAGLMLVSTPAAFAQVNSGGEEHGSAYNPGHGSAYTGDHASHDHAKEPHAEHNAGDADIGLRLADQPKLAAALAAGGEPVVAKVLGAVCDFCAKAMNKTFGKRDDVAAVYVDLDAKTLNLVLVPGATMTDKALKKAVKKSGYKVDSIARGAATLAN